ncbi:interactor of constitutive active ROPs 4-like [Curcuma longa]|uniref:interactor of constitutive active ROPs 4-like n=1 Tax=Curcuma longa TaxID=136217 RepID=UPI003D9DCB52
MDTKGLSVAISTLKLAQGLREDESSRIMEGVKCNPFADLLLRNRAFEFPKRPAPLRLQTSSEANVLHRTVSAVTGAAPKSGGRHSPRGCLHENEKKRGTRDADQLELKLGEAEEELEELRAQLALGEAAKLDAERAVAVKLADEEKERVLPHAHKDPSDKDDDSGQEVGDQDEEEGWRKEMAMLKAFLLEKEKEAVILREEAVLLRASAAAEMAVALAAARAREEALMTKVRSVEEELKQSAAKEELLAEQLRSAETEKTAAEAETKRLRAQNEQWRKATEAATEALEEPGEWGPASMAREEEGNRNGFGVWVFGDLWKKKAPYK